jgi:hypothetical protein
MKSPLTQPSSSAAPLRVWSAGSSTVISSSAQTVVLA